MQARDQQKVIPMQVLPLSQAAMLLQESVSLCVTVTHMCWQDLAYN